MKALHGSAVLIFAAVATLLGCARQSEEGSDSSANALVGAGRSEQCDWESCVSGVAQSSAVCVAQRSCEQGVREQYAATLSNLDNAERAASDGVRASEDAFYARVYGSNFACWTFAEANGHGQGGFAIRWCNEQAAADAQVAQANATLQSATNARNAEQKRYYAATNAQCSAAECNTAKTAACGAAPGDEIEFCNSSGPIPHLVIPQRPSRL